MEIKVRFAGGPLHDQYAMVSSLTEARVFFPPRERSVLLYVREDELVYVYDPLKSGKLTEIYDVARAKLGIEDREQTVRFLAPGEAALGFLPRTDTFEQPPFVVDDTIEEDDHVDFGD